MKTTKVSLIGTGGVGKTTLIKMMTDQVIPQEHIPTIAFDFQKLNLEHNQMNISVWELGGQQQFRFMWDDFIKGSNLILVVSDSTSQNVAETKKIVDSYSTLKNQMIIVANKQDAETALDPTEIEKQLGVKTIGMVAIDETKKRELLKLLEDKMKSL